MRALAAKYGFEVTVMVAPTMTRLYASYFDNFPRVSTEPFFINYVEGLARRMGFEVLELYRLMEPYAGEEMLYWSDDNHWNEAGHRVVANIIAEHVIFDR